MRLLAVPVGVSRRGALDEVTDSLPRVAGRVLGLFPLQAGRALETVPVVRQLLLHLVERPSLVLAEGVGAVAIGGFVFDERRALGVVGPGGVVLTPVSFLGVGVDHVFGAELC